ncbi:MAG: hypothetical protein WD555_04185 [Fulvivirga sp.]
MDTEAVRSDEVPQHAEVLAFRKEGSTEMVDMAEDKARALGQVLWKGPERKRKNLIRLGVDQVHAYAWSRTRKGGWAVAQSPILITTITLSCLRRKEYESMLSYYLNTQPIIQ